MNIFFIIRYFYPFIGGTEKQALALASQLVTKGVTVTIVTSCFERKWPRCEFIDGVRVIRLFSPRIKVVGAILFLICLAGYLIKHRKQYDFIHTLQIGYTSSLSIVMGILLRKPTLLKLASSGRGGDIQRARQTIWGTVFLYVAKKASRIIMVSTTVEQELMTEGINPSRLSRISNGVNVTDYKHCENKSSVRKALNIVDKKTIIYTGRLSPEKGVTFLVKSFSKVERSLNCQLLIIADGPEKKKIMSIIEQCKVSDSVLIIPQVDDVAPYLKAADLFILPSRFEGLSNSLLEAMACALPVISTKVGGSTDIIEHGSNGLLVDVDDEQQVRNAITQVFNDSRLAARLGKRARKTIEEQYDLNTIADRYMVLYKNCATIR